MAEYETLEIVVDCAYLISQGVDELEFLDSPQDAMFLKLHGGKICGVNIISAKRLSKNDVPKRKHVHEWSTFSPKICTSCGISLAQFLREND